MRKLSELKDNFESDLQKAKLAKNKGDITHCKKKLRQMWEQTEFLRDLKGWLNQGVWAAFCDRYAMTDKMPSNIANDHIFNAMQVVERHSLKIMSELWKQAQKSDATWGISDVLGD